MATNYSVKEIKAKNAAEGKEPVKKLNITTKVKTESATDKLLKRFVKTDAKGLKEYVINEFLIPNAIRLVRDTAVNAIDMLLLGKMTGKSGNNGNTNYTSFSGSGQQQSRWSGESNKQKSIDRLQTVLFNSRQDAEDYIDAIRERIRNYGRCSLLDCFDMLEKTNCSPTDDNYGWKDFSTAAAYACQGGFAIDYPRVICIN